MFVLRFSFFTIGLFILTLGIALIIKAGLGASAWDALAVGESNLFGITVGTAVFINGFILIFLNSFILKKKPDLLSAATILIIGMFIDFWLLIVFNTFIPENLLLAYLTLIIGIITLGVGVAIYLQAKFPSSPMDMLMVAVHERFGFSLRTARIMTESFALLLAFIFRGAIGVGTIIVTLTLGFVVQFFYPKFEQLLINMSKKRIAVSDK